MLRGECELPSGRALSELDQGFRDDPHPGLDRLREEAPRYLDPASGGARLFLTRHGDVRVAMVDRTLTRDAATAPSRNRSEVSEATLLTMEGAEHRLGRKLVGRAFDRMAVEGRRDSVAAIVDRLLDAAAAKGEFDAIADFAAPLPILAIADILGLPDVDAAALRTLAEDAGILTMLPQRSADEEARMAAAAIGLMQTISAAIAVRRVAPLPCLISDLIAAEVDGARLSDEKIARLCLLLVVAGSLTTTDVIGNAIALLLRHPEQLALLRAEPALVDAAVEEVLRFDPPVSAVARHTSEARTYMGCALPAGGTVKASLIAANRDPDVFPDPHAFRIDRPACDHVAFGGGAHACPGAAMARMEAAVALQRLFQRFPQLRLAGEAQRKTAYGFRGFARLPLATR